MMRSPHPARMARARTSRRLMKNLARLILAAAADASRAGDRARAMVLTRRAARIAMVRPSPLPGKPPGEPGQWIESAARTLRAADIRRARAALERR